MPQFIPSIKQSQEYTDGHQLAQQRAFLMILLEARIDGSAAESNTTIPPRKRPVVVGGDTPVLLDDMNRNRFHCDCG
jgi:hypothetical protein